MNRLDIIANQIKSKTTYLNKSIFEDMIKSHERQILDWLESLKPIVEQIKELNQMGCEKLQKRNYVRILGKLYPQEYGQFVSLNILIRDIDYIVGVFNIRDYEEQYYMLVNDKRLKFPGRYNKYVSLEVYKEFMEIYKDDIEEKVSLKPKTIYKDILEPIKEITAEDLQIEAPENKCSDIGNDKKEKNNSKPTDWLKILTK